jgi:hypothetical protein
LFWRRLFGVAFLANVSPPARSARHPYRSFTGLIDHLAILTRNQVRFPGTRATVPLLTEATSDQRQAFNLVGASIPVSLK